MFVRSAAQEEERVIIQSGNPHAACQSILEGDTEPQVYVRMDECDTFY